MGSFCFCLCPLEANQREDWVAHSLNYLWLWLKFNQWWNSLYHPRMLKLFLGELHAHLVSTHFLYIQLRTSTVLNSSIVPLVGWGWRAWINFIFLCFLELRISYTETHLIRRSLMTSCNAFHFHWDAWMAFSETSQQAQLLLTFPSEFPSGSCYDLLLFRPLRIKGRTQIDWVQLLYALFCRVLQSIEAIPLLRSIFFRSCLGSFHNNGQRIVGV